jgi:hypothetical protein
MLLGLTVAETTGKYPLIVWSEAVIKNPKEFVTL